MIALTWEHGYDRFYAEAKRLVAKHWDEVGSHREVLDLKPDHARYRSLEAAGVLQILCARDDGRLVGYFLMLAMVHPRDRTAATAMDDSIYADPAYRKERLGLKMMDEGLALCDRLGINIVFFRHRAWRNQSDAFLRRRGFEPHEMVYAKVLSREKGLRRAEVA